MIEFKKYKKCRDFLYELCFWCVVLYLTLDFGLFYSCVIIIAILIVDNVIYYFSYKKNRNELKND